MKPALSSKCFISFMGIYYGCFSTDLKDNSPSFRLKGTFYSFKVQYWNQLLCVKKYTVQLYRLSSQMKFWILTVLYSAWLSTELTYGNISLPLPTVSLPFKRNRSVYIFANILIHIPRLTSVTMWLHLFIRLNSFLFSYKNVSVPLYPQIETEI